jgi:hypothetical protein
MFRSASIMQYAREYEVVSPTICISGYDEFCNFIIYRFRNSSDENGAIYHDAG